MRCTDRVDRAGSPAYPSVMLPRRQVLAAAAATTALGLLEPFAPPADPTWSAQPFERKDYSRLCRALDLPIDGGHVIALVREAGGYRAKRYDQLQAGDVFLDLACFGVASAQMGDGKGGSVDVPEKAYVVLGPAEKLAGERFSSVMVDLVSRARWS